MLSRNHIWFGVLVVLTMVSGTISWSATATAQTESARPVITLDEARLLLHENSFDISIATDGIERAQQLNARARAALIPTLNIGAGYIFRDQEIVFEQENIYGPLLPYLESVYQNDQDLQDFYANNPDVIDARALAAMEFPPVTIQLQHDLRASATVTQILFDGRVFSGLDQTKIIISQAETGVEQVELALQGGLNMLYFEAVGFSRFIQAAERNLELAQINYDSAQAAFEEEVGSEFEMIRSEVALRNAENDLENAKLAYDLSIQALVAYLVLDTPFDVTQPAEVDLPDDLSALVDRALEERPEIRQRHLAIELDEERIFQTRLEFWPTFLAQAQANLVRETGFSGDPFSWSISVMMSWDLWDGGTRRIERQSRYIEQNQDVTRLEQEQVNIANELEMMWLRAQSQQRQVETSRSSFELAQLNVELTEEAWRLGAASRLDVDVARSQLFLAELGVADSEVRLQGIIYEIYRLSGAPLY